MTDIEELAQLISENLQPIPLNVRLWDAHRVGEYLGVSASQVRDRYSKRPDFPAPIALPSKKGVANRCRWKAMQVIRWAESLQG